MKDDKQRTSKEVLDDLYSFAFGNEDTEDISANKAIKDVQKSGVDLDKMLRFVEEQATIERKQNCLKKAKAKRQQLLHKATRAMTQTTANIRDEVFALIKGLESKQPQQAAVYFNRFKNCSDEDLCSLKEDLLILQQIESEDEERGSETD